MEQSRERQTDAIEQAQERMDQFREHLDSQEIDQALEVFGDLHPADQAELLTELGEEQQRYLLKTLSPQISAKILDQMEPEDAADVFGGVDSPVLSDILDEARPDVAADFLGQLPQEQFQAAMEGMEEAEDVTPLLEYPSDSAGGIMTPEYVSVRDNMSAAIALDSVRIFGPMVEGMGYIVIVDETGKLVGSLSIARLALARPTVIVRDIMDPEIAHVTTKTDQEECAHIMERYDLSYLPVVDNGFMVGVILVQDVVDVLEQEATEDMYRMTGIGGERLFGPLYGSVGRRLPWLSLNLATTLVAALVISLFESTIARVVTLAVFLPVVAGQGGIAGTQTLTLVIRGIALGDVPERRAFRILSREIFLGVVHGVLLGLVIGLVAFLWKGNWTLGVVLGTAMLGNMIVAGLAGAATPLMLRLFGLDPALGAAVIVTTITDVIGFLLFLGIAAALISYLV